MANETASVDYHPPSDHSSALQLLSLAQGTPPQQLQHDSPPTTHGRNHKKRRMLEAQAAARENQILESPDGGEANGDNHHKPATSLHEEAIPYGDHVSTVDETKDSFPVTEQDEEESTLGRTKMGHKRTGPRRQSALPFHRREMNETAEDAHDDNSLQPVVKKRRVGRPNRKKRKKNMGGPKWGRPPKQTQLLHKEYVDDPTDKDILLGRNKFNNHPGNVVYRETVRKFQPTLQSKNRQEVSKDILNHFSNVIGGRFLKIDGHGRWEVMSDEDALTKLSKALTELRSTAGSSIRKPAKMSASVLESSNEDQTTGRRPRRRAASMVRKPEIVPLPSSPENKRVKLPRSQNDATEDAPRQNIVEVDPTFEEYTYKPDPSEYYMEETAHIYHNPPFPSKYTNGVKIEDLRPVPPPPPLPTFPNNETCQWTYDETTRVLIADFSVNSGSQPLVTLEDSKFLFEMQERTDITVISRGLLNMSKIDPAMWNLEYLRKCVGREFYHKFRRFDKIVDNNGMESYKEKDNLFSMRFGDYVDYCEKRESFMAKDTSDTEEPEFAFEDHKGEMHSIGVGTSALYMIDVDIKRLTPLLNKNFLESFELPSVLPGGSHCMMNSVTPDARPFMGPNLYVTPPASFTHFHQDGHGTVDSGHLCISGFNEVVMLRRLTERHKKHALWILSGKNPRGSHFDGLYSMPHGDGLGEKPKWPNTDMIEDCKKMGYCPSVFSLEPGDLVHINKGRLHAFRKMSTAKLPEWDCHAHLRRNIIESKGIAGEEKLCVSVAWDWMYRGVTPEGINREVSTVLEASSLNRKNGVTSLAIPELSLLQMAKAIPARSLTSTKGISFLGALKKKERKTSVYDSTKEEICKGIYPGLCVVVGQHVRALNVKESMSIEKGKRLSIANIPDTQENPQTCPLDPYGDSDFQCKLCRKELSNVYFHCDGCEKLLSKDFNICRGCYVQEKFNIKVQMHPSNPKRHATLNHMGNNKFSRKSRCPCKNGPACNYCGYCLGCSCRCHTWFTMRTRLCNAEDEEKLLGTVKDTAAAKSSTATDAVPVADTVKPDDPTKHLYDRLKDAGEELLNEEKKDDAVKEGKDEESPNNEGVAKTETNEGTDGMLPSGVKKEEDENGNTQNEQTKDEFIPNSDERTPAGIKQESDTEDENGGSENAVKPTDDETSRAAIKEEQKENGDETALIEKRDENGSTNTYDGHIILYEGNSESAEQIEDDDTILI